MMIVEISAEGVGGSKDLARRSVSSASEILGDAETDKIVALCLSM